MDDRSIEDSQIAASSNTANYLPSYGRLNNIKSANMGGSWCAGTSDENQYLQIDMKKKMTFSGIATQGAGDAQNWLTKFKIKKSDDGNSFTDHTEFGIAKVMITCWLWLLLISHLELTLTSSNQCNMQKCNQLYRGLHMKVHIELTIQWPSV